MLGRFLTQFGTVWYAMVRPFVDARKLCAEYSREYGCDSSLLAELMNRALGEESSPETQARLKDYARTWVRENRREWTAEEQLHQIATSVTAALASQELSVSMIDRLDSEVVYDAAKKVSRWARSGLVGRIFSYGSAK